MVDALGDAAGESNKSCCANGGGKTESKTGQGIQQSAAGNNTINKKSGSGKLPEPNMGGEMKQAKIIFMGDAKVGKTSIIRAFIDDELQRSRMVTNTNILSDFSRILNVQNEDGSQTQI